MSKCVISFKMHDSEQNKADYARYVKPGRHVPNESIPAVLMILRDDVAGVTNYIARANLRQCLALRYKLFESRFRQPVICNRYKLLSVE